jgi:hypothetical protein
MGFATALTLTGIGMQTFGAIQQGRAARAEGERNAQIAEQNAAYAKRKAEFDMLRAGKAAREGMGRLRAKQAHAGARLDVGAPVKVAAEQWGEYMLNKWLIGEEGRIETERWLNEADLARIRGRNAQSASYWQAGTSLLTGFGTMRREGMLDFGSSPSSTMMAGSPYSGARRFTSSLQR